MATSLDEACQAIEKSIEDNYSKFGKIFQPGKCPSADLIYGVKMHQCSKMFGADGPVVTEKPQYYSGGVGYYMADFLSLRLHDSCMSLRQCIILAAYVIFQAGEHVSGCGGDSHIAVLRNYGSSGQIEWKHVDVLTTLLRQSDKEISKLIMKYADFDLGRVNTKYIIVV